LLCTAWHIIDPEHSLFCPPYKKTHINHPCAIWVRESSENYKWLCKLGLSLCKEYTIRYEKTHKCQSILQLLNKNIPTCAAMEWSDPPQAMPEEYKCKCSLRAYRNYYINEKTHLFAWKNRPKPRWIQNSII
tara:strand:+ start:508 stop:903 length:396 start_codon:yes stop_codon:yes gene_type:complete